MSTVEPSWAPIGQDREQAPVRQDHELSVQGKCGEGESCREKTEAREERDMRAEC
jgi:hypothetical protein